MMKRVVDNKLCHKITKDIINCNYKAVHDEDNYGEAIDLFILKNVNELTSSL